MQFFYFKLPLSPWFLNKSSTVRDPRILAAQLAQKAQRRRDRGCMRPDDITVIVVDVNPLNFITVGGKVGGSGAMGSDSGKDKCLINWLLSPVLHYSVHLMLLYPLLFHPILLSNLGLSYDSSILLQFPFLSFLISASSQHFPSPPIPSSLLPILVISLHSYIDSNG